MIGFSDIRENSQDAKDDYACEQSDRIQKLTNKIQSLTNKWMGLKAERDSLKAERDAYKDERDAYKDERDCLKAELDELRSEWEALGQVKSAATYLLENYSGAKPSAGEVDALAEDITQLLTEKYNISKGII